VLLAKSGGIGGKRSGNHLLQNYLELHCKKTFGDTVPHKAIT